MRLPHRIAPVGQMRDQAARGYRPLPVSAVIVFAASSATFIDRSAMRRVTSMIWFRLSRAKSLWTAAKFPNDVRERQPPALLSVPRLRRCRRCRRSYSGRLRLALRQDQAGRREITLRLEMMGKASIQLLRFSALG